MPQYETRNTVCGIIWKGKHSFIIKFAEVSYYKRQTFAQKFLKAVTRKLALDPFCINKELTALTSAGR